ncbi:MAG: hypothetical protein OXU20_35620 [Myxococcales bacterium]|nr:hypothetical protein [Myxococcales bacterium]
MLATLVLSCSRSDLPLQKRSPATRDTRLPDFKEDPTRARADRIDLLFVIDDSGSMQDKQRLFRRALPDMVARLSHPRCVDSEGVPLARQPSNPGAPCPDDGFREFNAVQDMHIGIVTTSVGPAGVCMSGFGDRQGAHLVPPPPEFRYRGLPFLAWDPEGVKDPPGIRDVQVLNAAMADLVERGGGGCPDEASLEAFYRFLIDPEPPTAIVKVACPPNATTSECLAPVDTDVALLAEREAFLRPDSLVAIILLSDENDCSVAPVGDAQRFLTDEEPMPRATTVCREAPEDPCCHSCGAPAPPGCPPTDMDPTCQRGPYTEEEDPLFLRCWEDKRRFGRAYRYPVDRYVQGLTSQVITDHTGEARVNPLFSAIGTDGKPLRDPSLVFFAAIVGVPWQDLAADPGDPDELHYLAGEALQQAELWDLILGKPGVPPSDPLMIESLRERSGVHPITGELVQPATTRNRLANQINGHEMALLARPLEELRSDLQYACIFPLSRPRDCSQSGPGCDCGQTPEVQRKPICQRPDGSYGPFQWAGKAFPGVRQLEVVRRLPRNRIAASICARNVSDDSRQDFGYRPALEALVDRLRLGLE